MCPPTLLTLCSYRALVDTPSSRPAPLRYGSPGVGMRAGVLYWHFVDIVWIAVYGIIYVVSVLLRGARGEGQDLCSVRAEVGRGRREGGICALWGGRGREIRAVIGLLCKL